MELISPSVQWKEQVVAALDEAVIPAERRMNDDTFALAHTDFEAYVLQRIDQEKGKNLKAGWVPSSEYWLVHNGTYIGRVNIRHELTEALRNTGGHIGYDIRPSERNKGYGTEILTLALNKARELGLKKVLLTCNETNLGSKKIVEANGGVGDTPYVISDTEPRKLRYWITL